MRSVARSKFIVLEGIDGAGKTVQAKLLEEALVRAGIPTHLTKEPSDWPTGLLIRNHLITLRSDTGTRRGAPGPEAMALLFAADRMEHLEREIAPRLGENKVVVCDRYVASSLAYQAAASGHLTSLMQFVSDVNARILHPDLTIVLDLDPETAALRRAKRGGSEELFDAMHMQHRVREAYAGMAGLRPHDGVVMVEAWDKPEVVHARVLDHVRALGIGGLGV